MNIGILGGTFNPIHLAHLRIAEDAREEFGLDQVLFIPAANPPHKLPGETSFQDRLEMVRRAIAGNPCFQASDLEGARGGTSYSIETLRELNRLYPGDNLFFIMGSDAFAEISTWHDYAAIFACTDIIVVGRPGSGAVAHPEGLPIDIAGEFCYDPRNMKFTHRSGHSVHYLAGIPLDISSSSIRRLARQGRSLRYLVPENVTAYIKEKQLYGNSE